MKNVWNGLCPAGKHGLDFKSQVCDLCNLKVEDPSPTHRITHIHRNRRHPSNIYALLVDLKTGNVVISATLDYILDAINERGYKVPEAHNPCPTEKP